MATKTAANPQATLLTLVQTARTNLRNAFDRGINYAEKRARSVFRTARSLSKRIDGARSKSKRRS